MMPKEAIIRTLTLLSTFGLGFEQGPQGEIIDGPKSWRVCVTSVEEIAKFDDRPEIGKVVHGLTQFRKRRILLDEEFLKDDKRAEFLIAHEAAHALSGSHQCEGEGSSEFAAALEITKKHYTILFEGEVSYE